MRGERCERTRSLALRVRSWSLAGRDCGRSAISREHEREGDRAHLLRETLRAEAHDIWAAAFHQSLLRILSHEPVHGRARCGIRYAPSAEVRGETSDDVGAGSGRGERR